MSRCPCHTRRRLLQASGAGLLLTALPVAAAPRQIALLRGPAWINDQPATPDSLIRPGDTLRTGQAAELRFVLGKDAYLMRERTTLTLEGSDSNWIAGTLRVVTGGLLAAFGRGDKRIVTPTVTAGIRGTGTYVQVDPQQSYFCTCYGTVELTGAGDSRQWVSTGHHSARVSSAAGIADDHMRWHTDEEVIALDQLVGRTPPFVKTGG